MRRGTIKILVSLLCYAMAIDRDRFASFEVIITVTLDVRARLAFRLRFNNNNEKTSKLMNILLVSGAWSGYSIYRKHSMK